MDGNDEERLSIRRPWDDDRLLALMRRWGGAPALVALFAVLHAVLLQLGYSLKVSIADPAVMWPAAGLALVTLWLSPRRLWPAILSAQFVVEMLTVVVWVRSFDLGLAALYTLANMAGALLGALLAHHHIRDRVFLRAAEVLWFVVVTAVGAGVSAAISAPLHLSMLGGELAFAPLLVTWQVWAAGQWAGIIAVAPLVAFWLSPLRGRHPELQLRSVGELVIIAALMLVAAFYVGSQPGRVETLLQLPTTIVLLMVIAVMRLPPRWVVSLFSMTAITLAWLTARNSGPIPPDAVLSDIGQLQVFLVTLGLLAFILSLTLAERTITARQLRDSDDRYRSFVQLSAETLWRVDLERPMPLDLPVQEQLAWLREHATVAEVSGSYDLIDAVPPQGGAPLRWHAGVPWVGAFEKQLEQAAAHSFVLDGLRFQVAGRGRPAAFIASFNGVVQDGHLQRMWGVARDVSELTELSSSLLRERERLKSYARQIVSAEEKARRATAVDLHDGIGQSLAGMSMMLDMASQAAPPEIRQLLDDVRMRVRDVQETTRGMISDLSPPGLYELGLRAALQWLAVYLRSHDNLQVEMDVQLQEDSVPVETRVLAFKLVRELLRNVVKHAGVYAARVRVRGDADSLEVEVADEGRGFEWQLDLFGVRGNGFGLWSVAERIGEVGGEFTVDTAPGRGTRFALRLPLQQAGRGGRGASLPAGAT